MEQIHVRIAGEKVSTPDSIEVLNPFTREPFALVPKCGAEHVERACETAAKVFARKDFDQADRIRVLERAADLLEGRKEAFAEGITLESGKVIGQGRGEVDRCVDTLRFSAAEGRKLAGEMVAMGASAPGTGKLGFAMRVPRGVLAAITPFNFPLNLVAHKLAPAIAAGCPVVLKPASVTPLSAIKLVELLIEAGMPEDWISVVTGSGKDIGAPLSEHEVPAMISFTGSPGVGWGIAKAAYRKKVSLELGSNSPLILDVDTDLDDVVPRMQAGALGVNGQSCISVQRVLVHKDLHRRFLNAASASFKKVKTGDPMDDDTLVGPLIRAEENDRLSEWIDEAVQGGAELVCGGKVDNGVFLPTIVDRVDKDARLSCDEVFAPLIVVQPFDSFDEALEMANYGDYGLHAGVFTRNMDHALKAVHTLDFGGVLINEVPTFRADQQPYGGAGESGNTREGPAYTVEEMTELRMISMQMS